MNMLQEFHDLVFQLNSLLWLGALTLWFIGLWAAYQYGRAVAYENCILLTEMHLRAAVDAMAKDNEVNSYMRVVNTLKRNRPFRPIEAGLES